MSTRDADRKRKRAFAEGSMPSVAAPCRALPDGSEYDALDAEIEAIGRIEDGTASAWDVLAVEALADRCFSKGCAIADGDFDSCPGWCALAVQGFEGWVMAS